MAPLKQLPTVHHSNSINRQQSTTTIRSNSTTGNSQPNGGIEQQRRDIERHRTHGAYGMERHGQRQRLMAGNSKTTATINQTKALNGNKVIELNSTSTSTGHSNGSWSAIQRMKDAELPLLKC
jgi:hypothetical protein